MNKKYKVKIIQDSIVYKESKIDHLLVLYSLVSEKVILMKKISKNLYRHYKTLETNQFIL